ASTTFRFLHDRAADARPDRCRIPQEILAQIGAPRQERPDRCAGLLRVATPAARDQVAVRTVAPSNARLDVIEGQLLRRENRAAIDAAVAIPFQDPVALAPWAPVLPRSFHDQRYTRTSRTVRGNAASLIEPCAPRTLVPGSRIAAPKLTGRDAGTGRGR